DRLDVGDSPIALGVERSDAAWVRAETSQLRRGTGAASGFRVPLRDVVRVGAEPRELAVDHRAAGRQRVERDISVDARARLGDERRDDLVACSESDGRHEGCGQESGKNLDDAHDALLFFTDLRGVIGLTLWGSLSRTPHARDLTSRERREIRSVV